MFHMSEFLSKILYNDFVCSSVGIFFESDIHNSSASHVFSILTVVQVDISLSRDYFYDNETLYNITNTNS